MPSETAISSALADKKAQAIAVLREAALNAPCALASSLSAEDMVLAHMITEAGLPIAIFTLETGRLAPETSAMIGIAEARFGVALEVYTPDPEAVAGYVSAHGRDAFYESVELRKACCEIRKVEPLGRALAGRKAWVTGQRREQAATRTALAVKEWDDARNMAKFNPLADWSWDDVLAYASHFDVPLNPLHARGYPSIGCDPCTRAIRPGEDPRAGRWWWESADSKECGLHVPHVAEGAAS